MQSRRSLTDEELKSLFVDNGYTIAMSTANVSPDDLRAAKILLCKMCKVNEVETIVTEKYLADKNMPTLVTVMIAAYKREQDLPPPKPVRRFECDECLKTPNAPMLKDEIWEKISHKKGRLCIKCAEQRMGRKITFADLLPCVANDWTVVNIKNLAPDTDITSYKAHHRLDRIFKV